MQVASFGLFGCLRLLTPTAILNLYPLSFENLREFARRRAKPLRPGAEDYPALALPGAIRTTRQSAIYAMHSYHQGKKPHDAIRQYIRHFSRPGELVLDPFCGSGGTALAAMLEGRTAIALDRSPAAVFIAQNYCTAIDPAEVQQAAEELMAAAQPELDWLYETRCDRCDGPARTAYTVYSEQFSCPHCGQTCRWPIARSVPIGSKTRRPPVRIALRGATSKPFAPADRGMGPVPVLAAYRCLGGCLPAEDQRRHNDADAKKREYFARFDLGKIEEIARERDSALAANHAFFRRRSPAGKPTFARRASRASRTCIRSGIFGPWPPSAPRRQSVPARRRPSSP